MSGGRKALEKVVAKRVRGRRPDETAWQDAMEDTADTIAAFLRALPDHFVMQSFNQPPVPGGIGNGSLHTIAAAVEAEGE